MIRRQSLIALGVAIVLGLVAVYLANVFLTSSARSVDPKGTTRIAVAAIPLDYGTVVTREKVKFVPYPATSLPSGTFASAKQLLGQRRVVLRAMAANEPILAGKVTGKGQNASLAAILPDGKRAASVRINDVSGVAGFVEPNDTVDVLITREIGDNNAQITDVLLQNIKVLAIGQDAGKQNTKPNVAKSATLEVYPLEAQKLALAQEIGSLSLVLRKPGVEQDSMAIETVSMSELRYGLSRAAPAVVTRPVVVQRAAAPRAPARAPVARVRRVPNNVEIVRGTEGIKYEVGRYGS